MEVMELLDILNLGENSELECKKSKNELPKSLWDTYSAMANTNGGLILLGVDEVDGEFHITGVENISKVMSDFWSILNGEKINRNILKNEDLEIIEIDDKTVIKVNVPRAVYTDKPIYLNGNPYKGTFKRNYEGDYKCSKEEVNAMIRDAAEEGGDSRILQGYDMEDVDSDTLTRYRNKFNGMNLEHPWSDLSDQDFLKQLGAIAKNRKTKEEGMTLAGLLVFGKGVSIREALQYLYLDFLDKRGTDEDQRWSDRFTIDGKWENNLYNFYTRVMPKLTEDLKVPFYMEGVTRVDETLVHKAIREAFVNALIHSDYNVQGTIKIERYKDHYEFSNPGNLKLPEDVIYAGGTSKSRNPIMQRIFRMIGLGENIGSGFPTILKAWNQQHWRLPQLEENTSLNTVNLKLWMVSLIPEECLDKLRRIYGKKFSLLGEREILALSTAEIEGRVTNLRLQAICDSHPNDLTKILSNLVQKNFLIENGYGRGKSYSINENYNRDEIHQNDVSYLICRDSIEICDNNLIAYDHFADEQKVLKFIEENGYIDRKLSLKYLGFKKTKHLNLCNGLIEQGLIKKVGSSNKVKYVLINYKE